MQAVTPRVGRVIRLPEVCHLTSMSRATIWRKSRDSSDFPKPFQLSEGITVWAEREILEWLHSKKDNVVPIRNESLHS